MDLFPCQIEARDRLLVALRNYGGALDGSSTGTGKTLVAVNVAKQARVPFVIVCPKAVIPSWQRWCDAFDVKPLFILNYERLRTGGTEWVKMNKRTFEWSFKRTVLFCWDECHRAKSPTSLNAKLVYAAKRQGHYNLMLSATAASSPLDMRALGYVLGEHKWTDFFVWAQARGARRNRWQGFEWEHNPEILKKLHDDIFPSKGVRLRIEDFGDAFPANRIIAESVAVEGAEEIEKLYAEAAEALKALKEKRAEDKSDPITKILRARQASELQKIPVFADMAKQLVEEKKQVAIFLNYTATLEVLASMLGTTCVFYGGNEGPEREANLQKFQSGEERIIICNIQAGGTGLSLHDLKGESPRVSLISPTFSAIDLLQVLGRIHRNGAKTPCLQYLIYASGTVEERVCASVQKKLTNISALNDGDTDPFTFSNA